MAVEEPEGQDSGWLVLPEADERERRAMVASDRLLQPMLHQLARLDLSTTPPEVWESYGRAPVAE